MVRWLFLLEHLQLYYEMWVQSESLPCSIFLL